MRNLEQIQQEYNRIQAILAWNSVTEAELLALDFPEDASFVQFTGRMDNRCVRGRLTRDRGGNVSINIDHTMLPCDLHDELRALQLNAGRIFLSVGEGELTCDDGFRKHIIFVFGLVLSFF